ncbi:uncharacterized protein DSM5745_11015 [Aspergillus mulundensis]|uniref:Uncharacterized protein n=1 Tax=Aspergillus mulundensis TaxID=1810919 RepID=A0A3D8QCF7_9EURO|nr:Uncharacterized protein DSM5745_11015 [Aspergillus mulundensis]RDW59320.1 Uncharacterized protein DSM5745_11015 [Aspergillus mulundensis]
MHLLSFLRKSKTSNETSSLYGLDHAALNLPVPPPSMWMNLGYWKDTTDFPTACAALLDQVLITASLLDENGDATSHSTEKRLRLLDVGIGCGDQSVRILGYKRRMHGGVAANDNSDLDGNIKDMTAPLFDSYVGITSIPVQAQFAKQRIESSKHSQSNLRAQIFCADAANPLSWDTKLKTSLSAAPPSHETEENWLLALDTLYHFSPSRAPLFKYTHSTLHASIMAFDLLLPTPKPSFWARLLLRILCLFAGTPYTNFLTQDEYTALLVDAGYDLSKIIFRDISDDVFHGIAGYINSREEVLKAYGLGGSKGMKKYGGAGKLFGWWARTGVVKGFIIVARA